MHATACEGNRHSEQRILAKWNGDTEGFLPSLFNDVMREGGFVLPEKICTKVTFNLRVGQRVENNKKTMKHTHK